jgi:hypothetical protein
MQLDPHPSEWRQPDEQPTQAPYAAPVDDTQPPVSVTPVVTLTSDETETLAVDTEGLEDITSIPPAPSVEPVRWQATEYIHREKSPVWFIFFAIVCVVFIIIAIFMIQSITFAILIPVMAAALIVYARRPPRILDYTLSKQGLHVNDVLYAFAEFKGFAVVHGDDEYSVLLIPVKRFKPGISVYFPEEAGEAIVDMLAARLPMQELHLDLVDQVIRKLRL